MPITLFPTEYVKVCRSLHEFKKELHIRAEKAKKDPFHPVVRSKGEKARNRSRRGGR